MLIIGFQNCDLLETRMTDILIGLMNENCVKWFVEWEP